MEQPRKKLKIGVVGAGVSGLAATWLLNEHSPHEVHLFEAEDRPGGHTNTCKFRRPGVRGAKPVNVDTGFIVLNEVTYPNFLRFLREDRQLPLIASEMSFSVTRDHGAYEWAGNSIATVFAQPKNLWNGAQWRLVWDIIRFNTCALEILNDSAKGECSIGEYLQRNGYSASFRDNYLLPMTAAIWSTPPDTAALDFPASTLIRFMHNHHLMTLTNRPQWLTIKNGSKQYVESILNKLPDGSYHGGFPVKAVTMRSEQPISIHTVDDATFDGFDHIIFASHADQTLSILKSGEGGPTEREEAILSSFKFSKNRAVLHADTALMPVRKPAWAAWNYISRTGPNGKVNEVALTYWMNLLQSIPEKEYGPVLVTLNPPFPPMHTKNIAEYPYEHPLFTSKSIAAQAALPEIQNQPRRRISFAGAWTKYGFHEDGFRSGLLAAEPFAEPPWPIVPAERPHEPTGYDTAGVVLITLSEYARRALSFAIYFLASFILAKTQELRKKHV